MDKERIISATKIGSIVGGLVGVTSAVIVSIKSPEYAQSLDYIISCTKQIPITEFKGAVAGTVLSISAQFKENYVDKMYIFNKPSSVNCNYYK